MTTMKHFVQLKDNVVFAYHQSSTEIDVPGDNIIEVDENGESYLFKRYENGTFLDPQLIKWAILDENNDNTVIGFNSSYFSSDINGPIVTDKNVKVLWKWDGSNFVAPETKQIDTILFGKAEVTTSEDIPALTQEQIQSSYVQEQVQIVTEEELSNTDPSI